MKLPFAVRLAGLVCIMAIGARQASACQCGSLNHGKNAWEVAKLQMESATVIFEGTPEHFEFELQWSVLSGKEGELIPADYPDSRSESWPRMLVTFRVQRAYKRDLGPKVQISTGLGGGDCGARFAPGLTYLVYGSGPSLGELSVNMCSPGGWIGTDTVAADLRYLRKERPISADLELPKRWDPEKESTEHEKQRQRNFEELKKRYAAFTGSICGTVIRESAKRDDEPAGSVSFLFTDGYSPVDHPITQVNQDGSFCSERLGPGKYYVYFARVSDQSVSSALYYPGVSDRAKATAIEVNAGRDQSGVIFKAPTQKTYSVRGFISTNDKSGLTANSVSVALISLDGDRQTWYRQAIDFQGSFPLPNVRFFNFETHRRSAVERLQSYNFAEEFNADALRIGDHRELPDLSAPARPDLLRSAAR